MFCYSDFLDVSSRRGLEAKASIRQPRGIALSPRLRSIAEPFAVSTQRGARIRTRLRPTGEDEATLIALGAHLSSVMGRDLAQRCREGRLDVRGRSASRTRRKRAATKDCTSRWAGAITRTSEDAWHLGYRNLGATADSLRARVRVIQRRLAISVGQRRGGVEGYASVTERFNKQRRLQILQAKLDDVGARLTEGRVSVCRGGRRLAQNRHHLEESGLSLREWKKRWAAARSFICADGDADKAWGNETIRWHPDERWLELKLPAALAHLANRPHGRYRLSCQVTFSHRGDEVAAQASSGAVRYDVFYDPERHRWYLDASWRLSNAPTPPLDELRSRSVLAVDMNAGYLAAIVVDRSGNPVGHPLSIPLVVACLPATTRDGHLRTAISRVLQVAKDTGCGAIAIENLDFMQARAEGREHAGRRPSRGRRGRRFRGLVAGIPTVRFRDRLVQMAANRGLFVIAVDPAYTSRWGAEHWLDVLKQASAEASGHHSAALVIGRRGLGQRARRRGGCDSTPPEDRKERATNSAVQPSSDTTAGLPEDHQRKPRSSEARGRLHQQRKTQTADGHLLEDQVAQDRLGPAAEAGFNPAQRLGTVH